VNAPAPPEPAGLGTTFGRYVLGPRLGVGGMGEVYHALQLGMGEFAKPLALKLLLPHLALKELSVQRFLDEAKLASRLNHPNVVQLFDVGRVGERYFIAMELVRGISLFRLVRSLAHQGQRLSEPLLLHVARGLCDGLSHAHSLTDGKHAMGLVHGDLTPDNVLVSIEGQVRLADFGIAHVRGSERKGPLVGKLGYVAPELLEHEPVDHRADLFGLGVTLFQAYTGVPPFELRDMNVYADQVLRQRRPQVVAFRSDASPAIAAVIERCLAAMPAERFESAAALKAALPTPPGNTAEELGELVKRLWGPDRQALEQAVLKTQQLKAGTERLGPALVVTRQQPRRSSWPVVAVAAGGSMVTAFVVGLLWARSTQAVEVLPSVPTAATVEAPGMVDELAPVPVKPVDPLPRAPVEPEPIQPIEVPPRAAIERKAAAALPKPTRRKPSQKAPEPPAVVKVGSAPGILVIDARPWAKVVVNGVAIGETPIASYPTVAGPVIVELTNPDSGRTVTRKGNVKAGESLTIREDLR
jgi:eukaryotic-like serine/threonine-protein kinase